MKPWSSRRRAYDVYAKWEAWPKRGFEMVEHTEPELVDFYQIRHSETGKIIRRRVPKMQAFDLIQFSHDVVCETMEAYAQNLRSLRSSQEDSEPGQPGEAGR